MSSTIFHLHDEEMHVCSKAVFKKLHDEERHVCSKAVLKNLGTVVLFQNRELRNGQHLLPPQLFSCYCIIYREQLLVTPSVCFPD